jgi:hypothetical protein
MALNSSGVISIGGSTVGQSINLELIRSATTQSNLNESALRTLAGKASGAIALSDFYGKGITLNNQTVVRSTNFGTTAVASITYTTGGDVNSSVSGDVDDWINPKAAASSNYYISATVISYSPDEPLGNFNDWEAMSSNRQWSLSRSGLNPGTSEAVIEISIGNSTGSVVLDTCQITLTCEVN